MDETQLKLDVTAATRQMIKSKRRNLDHDGPSNAATKRVQTGRAFETHTVSIPDGYQVPQLDEAVYGTIYNPIWTGSMAKTYPFQLDTFQATAIACVERKESVLVAAHTSAGKTAVAEYAIAKSLHSAQRVVYTSPLKALSNQKYRELSEEFSDVGLMTGDVTLNPNASCIVMTTEILRSMIYRGSEILREVAWVIFDEVHYMQDRERGVVWEEVIIFMPRQARMIFLSATLPNASEFADWVAHVHGCPCHVVYTDYRPTPLVHYGFPVGGNGLYLLCDERGTFRTENYKKLAEQQTSQQQQEQPAPSNIAKQGSRRSAKSSTVKPSSAARSNADIDDDLLKIAKLLKEKQFDPIIFFSFSRRDCERYARVLYTAKNPVNFNSPDEADEVTEIFNNALDCLSAEDRELSFIQTMLPMLQRGIGVHHSGLLPILKELVELLFQEQLIKCLFSTETFAMGLNMPAKTVVFTALKKFDGQDNRWVGSGEYIQMSGRAGRRGKDDRGFALMMVNKDMDEETCRNMLCGRPSPLLSSFKLTYYTLLNLLKRVEGTGMDMEYIIGHSFSQFQHNRELPKLKAQLEAVETEVAAMDGVSVHAIAEYVDLQKALKDAEQTLLRLVLQPQHCLHFLRPGRIVHVVEGESEWGYGVVVNVLQDPSGRITAGPQTYLVDTLLCCSGACSAGAPPIPGKLDETTAEMQVISIRLPIIAAISSLRISLPQDLRLPDSRKAVLLTLRELVKKHDGLLPALDPVADMGIDTEETRKAVAELNALKSKLGNNAVQKVGLSKHSDNEDMLKRRASFLTTAQSLRKQMRESQLASFQNEAVQRRAVLRKLGHIDGAGIMTNKGRAASEITTADELITAELMFNGTFSSLSAPQVAALVSCLVPVDKTQSQVELKTALSSPLTELQQTALYIAGVERECKMDVDPEAYAEGFRPSLMDAVYAWSKGASFQEVCNKTDIFEGSIIRAMRRLDELLHNLELAASVTGDETLAALFKESWESLQRGLPFAASLYL